MNAMAKNILGIVIASAICANVTILFQFGERLARIESKLESMSTAHIAGR